MAEMAAVSDCRLPQQMRIVALRYLAMTRPYSQLPPKTCNERFAAHGKALRPTPISPWEAAL